MAIKTLTGVIYDNGPNGQAFGGGIYNINASFGGSTEPTKVVMNVVSENGQYQIDDSFLDATPTGGHQIKVGGVTLYNMYLTKYGFNQQAGQRTLNVVFQDASICLDKIYVGLNVRHAPATAAGSRSYTFDIQCQECNSLTPNMLQTTGSASRQHFSSAVGTTVGHPMAGGYILVGEEQWSDGACEIPQVDYSFSELLAELNKFSIPLSTNLGAFERSPTYRKNPVGTLREVLNGWASDFAFEFFMDPFESAFNLKGVDLTSPSTTLDALKSAINSGFSSSSGAGEMVRSYEESRSLEGTYSQTPIVTSLKKGGQFTRNQVAFEEVTIKPLKVTDAIGYEGHMGRTNDQLYTSIALAKYQTEARLIWLSSVVSDGGISSPAWPSLGFIPHPTKGEVTDDDVKQQIVDTMGAGFGAAGDSVTWSHPIWKNPSNYHMYVGVYNESFQRWCESFDQELADFIGKYGYFSKGGLVNPPESFRRCPDVQPVGGGQDVKLYDLSSKVSTLPNGNLYKGKAYPFQSILRANKGVLAMSGGQDPEVYIVELQDNAWGTDASWVDDLFQNEWVEGEVLPQVNWQNPDTSSPIPQTDLSHYVPVFARLTANVWQMKALRELRQMFPDFDKDYIAQDKRIKGYFPGIAIIPKMSALTINDPTTGQSKEVLHVATGGTISNAKVYDNKQRRIREMAGDKKKECVMYCEEDVVQQVCKCPDIQDPIHHFSTFDAESVLVRSYKGSTKIILPIESDYIGYWKAEMTYRGTYPKQVDILGTPPAPSYGPGSNYLEARINEFDAKQMIDPHLSGNKMVQKYIIFGHSSPLTIQQIYLLMAAMNTSVTMATMGGNAPTQRINVQLDGTDYGAIAGLINPAFGLIGFNISLDGEGLSSSLDFANRHPKPPNRDVLMQQIGPRALHGQFNKLPMNTNYHSGLNTQFIPWH